MTEAGGKHATADLWKQMNLEILNLQITHGSNAVSTSLCVLLEYFQTRCLIIHWEVGVCSSSSFALCPMTECSFSCTGHVPTWVPAWLSYSGQQWPLDKGLLRLWDILRLSIMCCLDFSLWDLILALKTSIEPRSATQESSFVSLTIFIPLLETKAFIRTLSCAASSMCCKHVYGLMSISSPTSQLRF